MLLVICFGNTLTLVAIWKSKKLQTVANMYVASLAVIDIMIGLFQSIRMFVLLYALPVLNKNLLLCAFILLSLPIFIALSGFCMLLIAVDRYIFILHPLKYESLLTPKRAGIAVGIICVVIPAICIVGIQLELSDGCTYQILTDNTFYFILNIAFFTVISVSITFIYTRILTVARRHIRIIHSTSSVERNVTMGPQKTWKLVKHFMVVFGIFFVCWLPTVIYNSVSYFRITIDSSFLITSYVFILLNSSTNSLVYAWMNRSYREAFRNMLCCDKPDTSFNTTTATIHRPTW